MTYNQIIPNRVDVNATRCRNPAIISHKWLQVIYCEIRIYYAFSSIYLAIVSML
jgi:hypothetical protein